MVILHTHYSDPKNQGSNTEENAYHVCFFEKLLPEQEPVNPCVINSKQKTMQETSALSGAQGLFLSFLFRAILTAECACAQVQRYDS